MNSKQKTINFYDQYAEKWNERYGNSYTAKYFLQNRIHILKELCNLKGNEAVLELGCGTGFHLKLLAEDIASGMGTDLSQAMIDIANSTNDQAHLKFFIDDAETCEKINDNSVDIVFFVGLLEHLQDPVSCFTNSMRVIKKHGALIGLTPNKFSPWYSIIKPLIGPVKHLADDRFYSGKEIKRLLILSGFQEIQIMYWGLVPPHNIGKALTNTIVTIEKITRFTPLKYIFGGIAFKAIK